MKFRRKHLLFAFVILLGILLIAWELFQFLPSVRLQYVYFVDRIGASDSLVQLMLDDDSHVRDAACKALIEGRAKSVHALLKGMDDQSVRVRRASVFTLGQIGVPAKEAIPLLRARLKSELQKTPDPKQDIRAYCAQAIGKIGSGDPDLFAEFSSWLKSDDREFRALALTAIAHWPRDVVHPILQSGLKDEDPDVRELTRKILGINPE